MSSEIERLVEHSRKIAAYFENRYGELSIIVWTPAVVMAELNITAAEPTLHLIQSWREYRSILYPHWMSAGGDAFSPTQVHIRIADELSRM